jgi:hypothetical protein
MLIPLIDRDRQSEKATPMNKSYAAPKIAQVIMKDYSLAFGEFQYEKDTIFGNANSYHSSVA